MSTPIQNGANELVGAAALYNDLMAVVEDCRSCSRKPCSDECREFAKAQVLEIAEKAAKPGYTQIYYTCQEEA